MITLFVNDTELNFEHSLVSLSGWESEFEKPFYAPTLPSGKTEERSEKEWLRYFDHMYIGPRKKRHLVQLLTLEQKVTIVNYITQSRTATTIKEVQRTQGSRENITSELLYYYLVALRIPFKPTDEWHLNRLLMLVKICSVKQEKPSKTRQSKAKLAQSMRDINEQRRRELGTSG